MISGSLGLSPSTSIGDQYAMFAPIHGSYPQAKGKNIGNPMAAILSGAMMLEHWGMVDEAKMVRESVNQALHEKVVTEDLNPHAPYKTSEEGTYLVKYILKN